MSGQTDPYAGLKTEEEKQAKYAELLANYEQELAEYQQKEYERKRKIYDGHMAVWNDQHKVFRSDEKIFHKNVAAFSAGSFGVSFAFINQIVPLAEAVRTDILVLSWIFFGLALILDLFDHLFGMVVHARMLSDINKDIRAEYDGKPTPKRRYRYSGRLARLITWLLFIKT
jgi:hypothetical protein